MSRGGQPQLLSAKAVVGADMLGRLSVTLAV